MGGFLNSSSWVAELGREESSSARRERSEEVELPVESREAVAVSEEEEVLDEDKRVRTMERR